MREGIAGTARLIASSSKLESKDIRGVKQGE